MGKWILSVHGKWKCTFICKSAIVRFFQMFMCYPIHQRLHSRSFVGVLGSRVWNVTVLLKCCGRGDVWHCDLMRDSGEENGNAKWLALVYWAYREKGWALPLQRGSVPCGRERRENNLSLSGMGEKTSVVWYNWNQTENGFVNPKKLDLTNIHDEFSRLFDESVIGLQF